MAMVPFFNISPFHSLFQKKLHDTPLTYHFLCLSDSKNIHSLSFNHCSFFSTLSLSPNHPIYLTYNILIAITKSQQKWQITATINNDSRT